MSKFKVGDKCALIVNINFDILEGEISEVVEAEKYNILLHTPTYSRILYGVNAENIFPNRRYALKIADDRLSVKIAELTEYRKEINQELSSINFEE